jgi:hypothetical protein
MMAGGEPCALPATLEGLREVGIRFMRLSFSDLHGLCRSMDLPLEMFARN